MQAQLFLKEANVSELLIETLKTTDDIELVLIALQFGIAYLLGGNTECQNSILSKLYEDHKNEVFLKLQRLITRLGRKITSRILENSGQ